jgi:hypothetical protein
MNPPPPSAPVALTPTTAAPVAGTSSVNNSRNKVPRPIAAVGSWADDTTATFPSTSSVLGDGSDTEDENANEVSAPFRVPHLWWKGRVTGPRIDVLLPVPMLLDNGAHIVLIHTDLVKKLGLCHRLLPEPETVNVAVKTSNALSPTTLTEWVKLSVTSEDGLWTSKTIHALIALNLCTLIILGLPFLIHNNIVTDHAAQTCIDKIKDYDLLNPQMPPPLKQKKLKLKEQFKQVQTNQKLLLVDLKKVLAVQQQLISFDYVKPVDIMGAINTQIETLSGLAELLHHEDQLKTEYHDIFELILHVDLLPTDVEARIKLKDTE